ncbi:major facilitator superfamily transporter [Whalleya microplaca]|nr:major facilitator superfamily transporter [Whalleya microplaca]
MALSPTQEPPPNYNSVRAWLAVFGASLTLFCTVGFVNAFGVYQEYYETYLPGYSASDISWIGSASIFLLYIGAPMAGLLVDKAGPTILLCVGSVGQLLAIFLASLCTKYYQLFLTQGLLLGASISLLFCPTIAVISRRMPHRRGLALGIVIGGSSIGGIIWPIMLDQLLYKDGVGFGWTMRIVGFTMLPLLAVGCLTIVDAPVTSTQSQAQSTTADDSNENEGPPPIANDTEKPAKQQQHKADFSPLKKSAFLLLCAGLAITYLGLFTPFFYVSPYAIHRGTSSSTAFYLISAINAASFLGRVVPGYLADAYGHFNLCALSVLAAGVIGFTWTAAESLAGLVIWCLAYGFASGAVVSLQGACAGKIAKRENQGTAVGLVTGSVAITALVGTPISGQILAKGGYLGLGMWTGVTLVVGGGILVTARLKIDRRVLAAH